MSPRMHRFIAAATYFTLMAVPALTVAGPASAQPSTNGGSAADRFGSCLAAQKVGQVLLMIDESGSLQQTDPKAARVTAAKYLVDQLAQFAADSGAAIDVGVAGFADDFKQEVNWTRLDATNLPGIESGIDAFRNHNGGADTDYWLALNGARNALNEHKPKKTEGQACQALAWFTDGKIDYSVHPGVQKPYAPGQDLGSQGGVDATIRAAQESICRPGGVADQLRSSGIVTFGIGLSPDASKNGDFDVLKSIVTGEPTSTGKCGDVVSPTPGDFYLAQNIDDLLFAFDAFSTPGQPPTTMESGACPGPQICDEAKHRFVLDRSVSSVSVLASADTAGLVPMLVPPNGPAQELKQGQGNLDFGGVSVAYQWLSDKSVSFRMANATAPTWQGLWALVFEDPSGKATAKTKSSIHISGDLYPAWVERGRIALRQDGTVPLTFSIVDDKQKPVDAAALLGKVELSAELIDSKGTSHQIVTALAKDHLSQPQELNLHGVNTGPATLRLTLAVTTADAVDPAGTPVPGTVLAPRSADLPVVIDPPVGYPTVTSSSIDFGKLEGAGTATGTVELKGPGCIWLGGDELPRVVAAPDGVTDVKVASSANGQSTCVKVADGAAATLPVTISVPQAANGAINGTVALTVAPSDASAPPVKVDVPFTLSVEKKLNTTTFWLAFAGALVLGIGIPLLLLYAVKWFTSRIPAGQGLRAEQIPVRVSGGSVSRNGQPFRLRDGELTKMVEGLTGPTRRLSIGEVELRAHIGLSPFGTGFVVASSPGTAGAAGKDGATHGKVPYAKLPLAVQNTWFVLHDPAGPEDAATVVLLVGGSADRSVADRLVADINEALPRVLADLRSRAKPTGSDDGGSSAPAAKDNPFASASTSGGGVGASPFSQSGAPPGGNPFRPSGSATPSGNASGPFGRPPTSVPPPRSNPFGGSGAPPPAGGQPGSGPPNPFRP